MSAIQVWVVLFLRSIKRACSLCSWRTERKGKRRQVSTFMPKVNFLNCFYVPFLTWILTSCFIRHLFSSRSVACIWFIEKISIGRFLNSGVTQLPTIALVFGFYATIFRKFIYLLQSSLGRNSDSVFKVLNSSIDKRQQKISFLYLWIHHNHFWCLLSFKGLPEDGFLKNESKKKETDKHWLFKMSFLSTACSLVSCTISLILGKHTRSLLYLSWLAKMSCEILSTHYFYLMMRNRKWYFL